MIPRIWSSLFCVFFACFYCVFCEIRWEKRTIDCSQGYDRCRPLDPRLPCVQEPIPRGHRWRERSNRPVDVVNVCPLNCTKASRRVKLSVTLKRPYTGSGCAKYHNYNYRRADGPLGDWYAMISPGCDASLTVWCPIDTDL